MARPKGSPNKRTLDAAELIREAFPGWDPLIELARMAADENLSPEQRMRAMTEVAAYLYPKRKAVEVAGPGGGPIEWKLAGADLRL